MKNLKNIFIMAGALALCSVGFTSCDDDDEYDFPGDPNNRVFTADNSTTATIVQTPVGSFASLDFQMPAKCNKKAAGDINVSFTIDNSLIDEYNAINETEYLPVPEEALVITNKTVTIPAGGYSSTENYQIAFTDNEDVLATIDNEKGYLIPVRIESISGGNAQAATSVKSQSFIVINVSHNVIDPDATKDNRRGTLVADRSGWTVTPGTDSYSNGDLTTWFDGNYRNHASVETNGDLAIAIVDLGKEYSFDGLYSNYYYVYWGNYGYEEGSFNGTKVYISTDNREWTSVGVVEGSGWEGSDFVGFYGPMKARYIKIEQPAPNSWSGPAFDSGDFNIYAVN